MFDKLLKFIQEVRVMYGYWLHEILLNQMLFFESDS